jgi:hypothetical protein
MMHSRCTASAKAALLKMAREAPEAYVEVAHKVQVARSSRVKGEAMLAVINSRYDVYLLAPADPGAGILVIVDQQEPNELVIADLADDLPRTSKPSGETKRYLAGRAARAHNIVPHDIHIVR